MNILSSDGSIFYYFCSCNTKSRKEEDKRGLEEEQAQLSTIDSLPGRENLHIYEAYGQVNFII